MSRFLKTIVAVLALIVAAGLIYFIFLRKSDNNILYKIPNEASTVALIDLGTLSSKLFLTEVGSDSGLLKQLSKHVPDSLKSVKWTSTGLGIPDKIAFFTMGDTLGDKVHFLTSISSTSRFNSFMDDLCAGTKMKIHQKQELRWLINTREKLLIAWNDKFVTGTINSKNVDESLETLTGILDLQKQQSIMSDSVFVQKQSYRYDIFIFSRNHKYSSLKLLNELNREIKSFVSYIHFNKGQLDIEIEITAQHESTLAKLLSAPDRELPTLRTDSAVLNLKTNVDPAAFQAFLNKLEFLDFKNTLIPGLNSWDGRLNLFFLGSESIKAYYISYEYDDNFNKIEVTKTVNETMMNIQAAFGQKGAPLLIQDGKDTLLFKGGNFLFRKQHDYYSTFNKYFAPLSIAEEIYPERLSLFVDIKKLQSILKEAKIDTHPIITRLPVENANISISADGKMNAIFNFADKNENVLYSIAHGAFN
jgi:hypothetical protein